jgi:1-acyl-sn-glycerol-3-phosphate acyltransferase
MSGVRTDPSSVWIGGVVVGIDGLVRVDCPAPCRSPLPRAKVSRPGCRRLCASTPGSASIVTEIMSRLWQSLASLWAWLVLGSCVLIWFPLMALLRLVTAPFDPGRYAVGYLFRRIGPVMATLNPLWRFRYEGTLPADPRRPYVVVSNHESFADILLISHLPWEMKWLSKAELFRIPVMGWMMQLAGDVPVKRGFGPSAVEAIARCREVLARRVSVMIFPEGTRSATADMLPFKDGAFRLAVDAGVPILPLAVRGTRSALPKHDWRFNRSDATVRVLEPVETAGLGPADVPALRDRVRDTIERARRELGGSRT